MSVSAPPSGNIRLDGSITAAGKGGVCIPTTAKNDQFKKLRALRDNQICFDCANTRPTWASVNHGVFLCLDCSATHRSMGVHLTFVRSVDLDEWTQRQIDAMRIGGNGPARAYFRKHGMTLEVGGGSSIKKYQSKVATNYRAELAKLVEAEAQKRGEGTAEPSSAPTSDAASLLQNLTLEDQKSIETEAKEKLAAARASADQETIQPKLQPAAALHNGKGKLIMGAGKLQKPGATTNQALLLKKNSSSFGASRLKVNKLGGAKLSTGTSSTSDQVHDEFENIEDTQRNAAEAEEARKLMEADEAMARQLQQELNNGTEPSSTGFVAPVSSPATSPVRVTSPPMATPAPSPPKLSKMEENMARLKAMNSDFFS